MISPSLPTLPLAAPHRARCPIWSRLPARPCRISTTAKRAPSVRAEHSYDNERNSAKRGMAKEETRADRGSVTGGEVPRGNECKCIEIQIIILSRRIVCPIAYAGIQSAVVLVRVKGLKGGIRGLLFSLVYTPVHCRLTTHLLVLLSQRSPPRPSFLSNLSAALTVASARAARAFCS